MPASMFALYIVLALCHCTLAASSSPVATPTVVSIPTNTYCPLLNPIEISQAGAICRLKGVLQNPSKPLSRSCWNRDIRSCYRACAKDPKCRSWSQDKYRNLCTTYGDSLADMGFAEFGPNDELFSDFQGCYACNSTLDQKTSFCPNTPTRINPPLGNYTCGVGGSFEDDHVVFRYAGATFDECYGYCARLDQYGGCSSFTWDTQGINNHPRCQVYLKSLYQKGFKAVEGYPQSWSLRGCFECDDPKPPVDPCYPPDFPPTEQAPNGNFSQTLYDNNLRKLEPKYWTVDNPNTRAVMGRDNNTYVRLFADGSHGKRGNYAAISQRLRGFDRDPTSPGRFYNLTYDIALVQYNVPSPGGYFCSFTVGYPTMTYLKLNSTSFPKTFTTIGPLLVDASANPESDLQAYFLLGCRPTTLGRPGGNATILLDNVKWTKDGHEVGNT